MGIHFQRVRRPRMERDLLLRGRTTLWLVTARNRSWLVQARKTHPYVRCAILQSMSVKKDQASRVMLLKLGKK